MWAGRLLGKVSLNLKRDTDNLTHFGISTVKQNQKITNVGENVEK